VGFTAYTDIVPFVLQHHLDLKTADAEFDTWTTRGDQALSTVAQFIWDYADWPFKYKTKSLTVASGDFEVAVPDDFVRFGPKGSVFHIDTNQEILHKDWRDIQRLRYTVGSTSSVPDFYAVAQSDNLFCIYPGAAEDVVLQLFYEQECSPSLFPQPFWDTVLLWGTADTMQVYLGDGRSLTEFNPRFRAHLDALKARFIFEAESDERLGESRGLSDYEMW
jgi:hypothetical protein